MPKLKPKKKSSGSEARFHAVRHAHSLELAEDYVEAIADLIELNGQARTTDIAKTLGVSHATVNINLGRLEAKGLVLTEKYRAVQLTEPGRKLAVITKQRHEVVRAFLASLNLPQQIVELDSEGLEHHLSPETVTALKALTRKINSQKFD